MVCGVECRTERFPVGVVASITPFNFPNMVPNWTIPNALTLGNCMILKPSEQVPLSAARIAELLAEAGLPDGVFNVVHGGQETVEAICDHPSIDAVTFVGSTHVAKIVYRRSRDELPARVEEVHHAEAEGVEFDFLVAPLEVLGDDERWVTGLRCMRMELGEPDDSGRRRPVPIEGSEFVIDCDMVVVAIGTRSNPILTASAPELDVNKWGYITADDFGMTNLPGVFAGGDIVRGAATVILAMGDGKRAAASIDSWLRGVWPPTQEGEGEAAPETATA